jgi:LEA14-like dessication related protein
MMVKRTLGCLLAVIFILGSLSGCAGVGKPLEAPRISLSNLQVQESTGLETVLLIQLRVLNPNEADLDIQGVDCELEINDRPFAYGISNTTIKVPAFDSEIVPVTVYSSVIDILKGLFGLQHRKELSYRLKGNVRLEGAGWIPSTLPFSSQGTFSFRDLSGDPRGPF